MKKLLYLKTKEDYKTYIYDKQKKGLMITEKKAKCNNEHKNVN